MSSACEMYHAVLSHWRRPSDLAGDTVEPPTEISHPPRWTEGRGLQSQMMGIDAVTYLPDDILVKVDRAAMSVSLETRAPFLDHHVVELAWSLPLSMKIRDGQGKWVLREVLHRFVPRGLVDRPKRGFGIPLASWLRGPLRDWAESLLDDKSLREGGFIDPVPVRKGWNELLTGRAEWGHPDLECPDVPGMAWPMSAGVRTLSVVVVIGALPPGGCGAGCFAADQGVVAAATMSS